MKKYINKKIILITSFIFVFLVIFFLNYNAVSKTNIPQNELNYTDTIPGQTTVYDFMSKMQNERKVIFTEKNYTGMGKLITSINGINNNGNQSWIYYVNGTEAQVGVSNYKINFGDTISWKYEKYE